jgi:hypothetical protein
MFDPDRQRLFQSHLGSIPPIHAPDDPVEYAYWRGWNYPDDDCRVSRDTDAYVAWLAGRETAQRFDDLMRDDEA